MGMFKGIEDAPIYERGKFFKAGFRGELEVKKTVLQETLKSGDAFIVEFEILTSNMPDEHPVGSRGTFFQKMSDKTVAFPSITALIATLSGFALHQREAIKSEVSPNLDDILTRAIKNPDGEDSTQEQNDLIGLTVHLETEAVKTQKGADFTRHNWYPTG